MSSPGMSMLFPKSSLCYSISFAFGGRYETIWVMEDDIDVLRNPLEVLDRIEELDSSVGKRNWDILFY